MNHLLLIGADESLLTKLYPLLTEEEFRVSHEALGLDAIRKALIGEPDIVVLSIGGREQEWQFCQRLLTFLNKPLMLLLSSRDERDRVKALNFGADDCMGRPFLEEEFVARIRALLRRNPPAVSRTLQNYFVDGSLVIDLTRKEVLFNDEPVPLTPTEFRFLTCFTAHEGQVLSHDQIMRYVWGTKHNGTRDSIKLYVYQLRQKLEPDPASPRRIVTRRGEGYMFQRLGTR
ncbi:MAG: response regulator transcription factor [Anaerolineae bacterium]|nr:response regulator transcription factor [Anaerolineae bacterium]